MEKWRKKEKKKEQESAEAISRLKIKFSELALQLGMEFPIPECIFYD